MGRKAVRAGYCRLERRRERHTRRSTLESKLIALVVLVIILTVIGSFRPFSSLRREGVGDEESNPDGAEEKKAILENGLTKSGRDKHETSREVDIDASKRLEILRKTAGTVCRIPSVCLLRNGSLTFPAWLRSHSSMMERNCGVSSLHFRHEDIYVGEIRMVEHDLVLHGIPINQIDVFSKVASPRGYFRFSRAVAKAALSDERVATHVCWTGERKPCKKSPTSPTSPVIVLNPSESLDEASDHHLASLFGRKISILELDTVLSFTEEFCFRSILLTAKARRLPSPTPAPVSAAESDPKRIGGSPSPLRSPSSTPRPRQPELREADEPRARGLSPPEIPDPPKNDNRGHLNFSAGGIEFFWFKRKLEVAVCRFHRSCISRDGKLYIPRFLSNQRKILAKRCGLRTFRVDVSGFFNESHETSSMELLNDPMIMPTTAPDFIHAFLPALTSLEALYTKEEGQFVRRCITIGGGYSRICAAPDNPFQLAMFLNPKLSQEGQGHHWINRFVRELLPPKPEGPKTLNWNSSTQHVMCFRSILVAPERYPTSEVLSNSHILYSANNLTRTKMVSKAKYRKDEKCHLKILALNGRAGNITVNGEPAPLLSNLGSIQHEVEDRGSGSNSTRFGGVTSSITSHYPELSSLNSTIQRMQECNVLLMAHGTGIMNLLFLRRQVLVIEVVPFGLRAPMFRRFARSCDARFIRVVARPDERGFALCMGQKNRNAVKLFRNVMRNMRKIHSDTLFYKDDDKNRFVDCNEEIGSEKCKTCLKHQRLMLDSGQVAWLILREGVRVCYDRKVRYIYP